MEFDYSKLAGRIIEKFGKQSAFAKAMGLSERSMSLKMTNQRFFKQPEIVLAVKLLELDMTDIPAYFYALKVQN